jgi:HK97 gp10 family phage protein
MAVVIKGLDSLMAKLDSMGGDVLNALEKAVFTTSLKAQADARANAPVDTGALKSSISMDVKKSSSKVEGSVYTNNPYSVYQELGTINMPAHPYMMPAINANRNTFESTARNELQKAIRKKGG